MRHITHFLRLKIFQQIGVCSTKVRNSIVFLSSSSQVEEFLLQQSRVLVQRSMSRQNSERITILTPQKRFIFTWGLWNCGIGWQGKETGWQHTPATKEMCLFFNSCIILRPEPSPEECIYFQDHKIYSFRLQIHTTNRTDTHLFALKINYVTQTQR